ncbi:MAG: hypothetical protein JKY31_08300, partial [Rhodobacteraceae bacterium]|nr:hypothetical protein [Paracoccaceae bacterium]
IDAKIAALGDATFKGIIKIIADKSDNYFTIRIQDNGIGLPADRARLFEPYVTHRDSGTGLGLSIVKKIIEEHDATLELLDAPQFDGQSHFGAEALIMLPLPTDTISTDKDKSDE